MGKREELGFQGGRLTFAWKRDTWFSLSMFGKEQCAYPILLSASREGWSRADNVREFSIDPFSKVFQHKDVYSVVYAGVL